MMQKLPVTLAAGVQGSSPQYCSGPTGSWTRLVPELFQCRQRLMRISRAIVRHSSSFSHFHHSRVWSAVGQYILAMATSRTYMTSLAKAFTSPVRPTTTATIPALQSSLPFLYPGQQQQVRGMKKKVQRDVKPKKKKKKPFNYYDMKDAIQFSLCDAMRYFLYRTGTTGFETVTDSN